MKYYIYSAYILLTAYSYIQKEELHFVPAGTPHPQFANKLWTCFQGINAMFEEF